MNIAVIGLGSIGSVVASQLATTNHSLHLHVRGERGASMALNGITVQGDRLFDVPPQRCFWSFDELEWPEQQTGWADVVFIATKAYDVSASLEAAHRLARKEGVVVALANGLGHLETLVARFGHERSVVATTTHGAYRRPSGDVHWVGKGSVHLSMSPLASPKSLLPLEGLLNEAGLNGMVHPDVHSMVWDKLMLNLTVNPLAALAGLNNGELLSAELFSTCMEVYREAANVARAERIHVLDELAFEHRLRQVLESTAENECSMLQDLKAGRPTEMASLNHAVVTLAERHGLHLPLNQALAAMVMACHP
ncbi:MAG: 2-dehydropantoate 2-reductase [Flavobacteriales bacterium]|nr:2-dehydropantoate 2-reductase [Flavobacteriales bacterium]